MDSKAECDQLNPAHETKVKKRRCRLSSGSRSAKTVRKKSSPYYIVLPMSKGHTSTLVYTQLTAIRVALLHTVVSTLSEIYSIVPMMLLFLYVSTRFNSVKSRGVDPGGGGAPNPNILLKGPTGPCTNRAPPINTLQHVYFHVNLS